MATPTIHAAFYAKMQQQLTSPAGEPTQATYIFTTIILGLIRDQNHLNKRIKNFRPAFYK